ncbi:hypothetical protein QPK87_20315 [Kamptonema cortianum]|nr:hypothetical protein [Oscillatoria laete-virens]MDK3158901.1 hypothetical protein [Kamptonema cortianum]MDL5052863.1 hypothetical protein [Oscillatoria laete-virens NRMC-F 0139]
MIISQRILLIAVLVVSLLFVIPALANVFIDFEDAVDGTPATSLVYPGVTFSSADWFILASGPLPTHHLIGPCATSLTINFDTPQTSASFIWASFDNMLTVDVLLGGNLVGTENFAGPYGSLATINTPFDQLVIDDGMRSGCAAIDDLSTTSAPGEGTSGIIPFTDGRINRTDQGAPVVLYANDGGLDVFDADGSGLIFSVSEAEIAAVAACPESNTVIASDPATGIILSRLSAREDGVCPFQLNAPTATPGKQYVIIFDSLSSTSAYLSYEQ